MKSLNQISFIDSSGNEIKLNANNTKEAAFDKVVGTVPLRDASGRFRIGNTGVSSTDGYVAVNKNYVDGRINALDKSDSAVAGQFVSAVSETNGTINVSRRAIVDSDGVVLKTGDQTITGTKTFESVNFINFKDPEGRTNTALPNVCSINMGDDTTLFDCDAVGRIGLIGRDDPNTPGQNPNHTTGIRFFRSSSDNTVPNDYGDFYYDSSHRRFEADKLIIAPRLQCTTAPASNNDVVRKAELDVINTRLDNLGFKQATVAIMGGIGGNKIVYRQGRVIYANWSSTFTFTSQVAQNYFSKFSTMPIFTLPEGFRPRSGDDLWVMLESATVEGYALLCQFDISSNGNAVCIRTNGDVAGLLDYSVKMHVAFGLYS